MVDDTECSGNWSFLEDDDDDESCISSSDPNLVTGAGGVCRNEGSTSNQCRSKAISHFIAMGFSEDLVIKTVDENGEENPEAVLETLLAYTAPEECPTQVEPVLSDPNSPDIECDSADDFSDFSDADGYLQNEAPEECPTQVEPVLSDPNSPDIEWDSADGFSDFSDADDYLQNEETLKPPPETKMMQLVAMGFSSDEVSAAINSCDPDTCVTELMDYISAAQMQEATSDRGVPDVKNKKLIGQTYELGQMISEWRSKRKEELEKRKRHLPDEDNESIKIPKVMTGFGIPSLPSHCFKRRLPDIAVGPPFFYFENVALTPKGVWSTISRSLFKIEPEFVDSKYFSAAARKRGYLHNLPTEMRFHLLPLPPLTIAEALPVTTQFWPPWDDRTKLNCLRTKFGTAKTTEKIRKALNSCRGDPPEKIQKYVLKQCRYWNFVWAAKDRVAPLEPHEMELILGYPIHHTRGGGISQAKRYECLGNTFQVDTVAYHLSVLKNLYPSGISVISLFSGIGGAEVALHRLGIPLKFVVSVELSPVCRDIFRNWWESTGQTGVLIDDITDVQMLTTEKLERLINCTGGIDLVIGGSPCNNLTGSNRWHRDGLDGSHSSLFFNYCRILKTVKRLMREK